MKAPLPPARPERPSGRGGAGWGRRLEDYLLITLLLGLMLLAAAQILLREVFSSGWVWADELLRIGVLWIALLGAVSAAREERQINIDVLSRMLGGRARAAIRALTNLFAALVCGIATYAAARFLHAAWQYEDSLLGGLPAWPFQLVLPLGFGLLCWRYSTLSLGYLRTLIRDRS